MSVRLKVSDMKAGNTYTLDIAGSNTADILTLEKVRGTLTLNYYTLKDDITSLYFIEDKLTTKSEIGELFQFHKNKFNITLSLRFKKHLIKHLCFHLDKPKAETAVEDLTLELIHHYAILLYNHWLERQVDFKEFMGEFEVSVEKEIRKVVGGC